MAKLALALDLRKSLVKGIGLPLVMKEDVAPQDMSFMDDKLKRLNKMMKKHPGKNPDWDPETKTVQLADWKFEVPESTTSRQVRRRVARAIKKGQRVHFDAHAPKDPKTKLQMLTPFEKVTKHVNPETGLVRHTIEPIKAFSVTRVITNRYRPHIGTSQRHYVNVAGEIERLNV